jgi:hypothetical protein
MVETGRHERRVEKEGRNSRQKFRDSLYVAGNPGVAQKTQQPTKIRNPSSEPEPVPPLKSPKNGRHPPKCISQVHLSSSQCSSPIRHRWSPAYMVDNLRTAK